MNNLTITYIGAECIQANGIISKAISQIDLIVPTNFCTSDSIAIFGVISFNTKYSKTIQFAHIKDRLWRAKLCITKDDVLHLANTYICLLMSSYNNHIETRDAKLLFDVEAINLSIRDVQNTEIAELRKELTALKQTLNALSKNYSLGILTTENTDYIQPGMVPMAIEGGKWVAQFPFVNMLKSVNGKYSADGEVEIEPCDIPTPDGSTLEDKLKAMHDILTAHSKVFEETIEQLKTLSNKVADIEIKISQLTNKGLL